MWRVAPTPHTIYCEWIKEVVNSKYELTCSHLVQQDFKTQIVVYVKGRLDPAHKLENGTRKETGIRRYELTCSHLASTSLETRHGKKLGAGGMNWRVHTLLPPASGYGRWGEQLGMRKEQECVNYCSHCVKSNQERFHEKCQRFFHHKLYS